MRILAFDCSTSLGSVALVEDGKTRFAETFDSPRGRGGAFFEVLERAMKCGRPDRVAVGIGPGSYNGLRTAITAAEALAFATGAERVGVLSVRALPCDEPAYFAIADARGGTFSFARIQDREVVGVVELVSPEVLGERLAGAECPILAPAPQAEFPRVIVATPDAVLLARIASGEPATQGRLEPAYLKPAHITQPRARK